MFTVKKIRSTLDAAKPLKRFLLFHKVVWPEATILGEVVNSFIENLGLLWMW